MFRRSVPQATAHVTDEIEMDELRPLLSEKTKESETQPNYSSKPEPTAPYKDEEDKEDEEEKKRKRNNGSSTNVITHVKEFDWSPLGASVADISFLMAASLLITNGGFFALIILGIKYWNKTEHVTKSEGGNERISETEAAKIKAQIQDQKPNAYPSNSPQKPDAQSLQRMLESMPSIQN
jgi:hypothetical protein